MSTDILHGQWMRIKDKIKTQWGRLTDGDIDALEGEVGQLVGKVQQRYGLAREQAEREVDNWLRSISARYPAPPP